MVPVTSRYRAEIIRGSCSRFTYCFKLNRINSVEDEVLSKYVIYPNPNNSQFNIQGLEYNDKVSITDINGRQLSFHKTDNNSFRVSKFKGFAIIQITKQNGQTQHLMIQIN